MTDLQAQQQLRQRLVLLLDEYIKLSDDPTWESLASQHPDLENCRQDVIESADNLWWRWRTKCSDF